MYNLFQTSTFNDSTLAKSSDEKEITDNIKDGNRRSMSDHNDAHDETLTFAETSQTLFYANECEPSNVVRKSGEHLGCYGESGDLPLDYNGME